VPSAPPTNTAEALGPDALELIRLVEEDLKRHEAVLNEHQRTAFTIRGLALTAVAALIAASYASFVALPAWFAIGAVVLFLTADYYYARLYAGVEQTMPVLESLSHEYRRILGRRARTRDAFDNLRGDLRSYSSSGAVPDSRPKLWPIRSLGPLKVFLPVYGALITVAAVSALYVGSHKRPGSELTVQGVFAICRVGPAARPAKAVFLPAGFCERLRIS
jgi:hypothetical protein